MNKNAKIVITGAAGFIGSCMASFLKSQGFENLILVDDFSHEKKNANTLSFDSSQKIDRSEFINRMGDIEADLIIHLGARTDTAEMDFAIHKELNLDYSIAIWKHCTLKQIPLIYASSAATYGGGEHGYKDDHAIVDLLHPLNPYGDSKQQFDQFVLSQSDTPPFWYGLKFFNVFGPNEYHKGRMASVVFHAFHQIKSTGEMKLFRSHNPDYKDGEQIRDFVYVKDVLNVIEFLMQGNVRSGIYNLGSGTARTFLDLVKAVFKSLNIPEKISFIDTPADIRDKYQYYTEADMTKLKSQGYSNEFYTLESAVEEYVNQYLKETNYF